MQQAHTCTVACSLQFVHMFPCLLAALSCLLSNHLQVWWEGDQCFYSGILALYDAVSTE